MSHGTVNKVILIGNLGKDPEVNYSKTGSVIATLSLATSESWKDKQTGQTTERTEWHKIVVFQRLAEIAQEYLRKGSKIFIEGKLQTRKWQDKSGADRYTTEIVGDSIQMLSNKGNTADTNRQDNLQNTSLSNSHVNVGTALQDDEIPF